MKHLKLWSLIVTLSPTMLLAQQVAKVAMLKGSASAKTKTGEVKTLKIDDWVTVGDLISTKDKTLLKLVFTDKSTMNMGPNSEMNIASMGGNEAGLINVIKGQIRSQVTKDVLKQNEDKSKLILKTKTAAMGIRGTDFMVTYNPDNQNTALVTFEGNVAMVQIDANEAGIVAPQSIDLILNDSSRSVAVTEGTFSASNPTLDHATIAVKISPAQFEALNSNKEFEEKPTTSTVSNEPKQAINSVLPPGLTSQVATNNNLTTLETTIKTQTVTTQSPSESIKAPPPEGMVDKATGAVAPPAGGFIDLKTSIYIAPPPGSTFDKVAGVYVPPPTFGAVNLSTGEYKAPEGLKLTSEGTFVPDKPVAPTTQPTQQSTKSATEQTQTQTTKQSTETGAVKPAGPTPMMAIAPLGQTVLNPTVVMISSVAAPPPPPPTFTQAPPPPVNDVMGGGFFVPGNYFIDQTNNGSLNQNTNAYSQLNVTVSAQ